jgi:hypothetical protein
MSPEEVELRSTRMRPHVHAGRPLFPGGRNFYQIRFRGSVRFLTNTAFRFGERASQSGTA